MKPNAIVIAEEVKESSLWYLTPGKEYQAEIDFKSFEKETENWPCEGYLMELVDDIGETVSCRTVKCAHLGYKHWRIVKVMNVMEVEL